MRVRSAIGLAKWAFIMLRFLLLGCVLLHAIPAQAQDLRLQDAIRLTLERSPKLQGHRFAIASAVARRDQAALRPPLQLGFEAENFLGTNRLSTFDDTELTLSLGTVLERGDKRARRIDVAERERDLIVVNQDAERLDLLAEVARRFIAVLEAQESARVAGASTGLARRVKDVVKLRLNAGNASPIEKSNADLSVIKAGQEEQRTATEVAAKWALLAGTWGDPPDQPQRVAGDLYALPPVGEFGALADLVERTPEILKFATERRIQEANLRLAEAGRAADVTVSAGIRRLQGERSQAAVFSLSIPLGSGARARPGEDEARSKLSGVAAEEAARRNELLATLYATFIQLRDGRTRLDAIRKQSLPLAQTAAKDAENAFRLGRFSLLELNAAQQQTVDLQREAIAVSAATHLLYLELERLIGRNYAEEKTP